MLIRQSRGTYFWINSRGDSNLRLCNIGIKCSTSRAKKKYMSTSIKNYSHVKRVKIKILVDFHEGSNLRSTILLSVTTRIQTLDLKISPSALPARQKKKFGWTTREDLNLIHTQCSYSRVERLIF